MGDVVTIDGPAGSGKSTVSRALAARLHFLYLDTGAMYRAVALVAKREGIDPADGKRLGEACSAMALRFKTDENPPRLYLGHEDITLAIRTPEIDLLSSTVSAVPEVREAMTDQQRAMARRANIVAEGRDMGTVVFPDATIKFFLDAAPEIRAERRYRERLERGESVSKESVMEEILVRDRQDQSRSIAPLRPAKDAIVIDSSRLTADQVLEEMLRHWMRKK